MFTGANILQKAMLMKSCNVLLFFILNIANDYLYNDVCGVSPGVRILPDLLLSGL